VSSASDVADASSAFRLRWSLPRAGGSRRGRRGVRRARRPHRRDRSVGRARRVTRTERTPIWCNTLGSGRPDVGASARSVAHRPSTPCGCERSVPTRWSGARGRPVHRVRTLEAVSTFSVRLFGDPRPAPTAKRTSKTRRRPRPGSSTPCTTRCATPRARVAAPQVGVLKRSTPTTSGGPRVIVDPEIVESAGSGRTRRAAGPCRPALRDRAAEAGHGARPSTSTARRSSSGDELMGGSFQHEIAISTACCCSNGSTRSAQGGDARAPAGAARRPFPAVVGGPDAARRL